MLPGEAPPGSARGVRPRSELPALRSFLLPWVALVVGAVACGGTTQREPLVCGGAVARVTPSGDTYDDTGSAPPQPIRFEMYVYRVAEADAGGLGEPPSSTQVCPTQGALAKSTDTVALAPGDYWLCRNAGTCGCAQARLTGGDATFYWGAGPGGGHLEVRGCGTTLR
jgi:hypothetical protein